MEKTETGLCGTQAVECSIEKSLEILNGKWSFLILRELFSGTKRFGQLLSSLPGISPKTLAAQLRAFEARGVLTRQAYATIPPTVEYTLTEKGESLKPIIKAMKLWGATWGSRPG
jgi:DNA-binding HxlR family transcriptional regulator